SARPRVTPWFEPGRGNQARQPLTRRSIDQAVNAVYPALTNWSISSRGEAMPGQKAAEATRREEILRAAHEVALRRGIDGLTLRAVAARARLSHGLVLFHFKRKDQLGLALLDRVLVNTVSLMIPAEIGTIASPRERLQALFRYELRRLSEEPRRIRLLLEYWARGGHNAVIRGKIRVGLDRYRAAFRNIAEEALAKEPGRFGKAT